MYASSHPGNRPDANASVHRIVTERSDPAKGIARRACIEAQSTLVNLPTRALARASMPGIARTVLLAAALLAGPAATTAHHRDMSPCCTPHTDIGARSSHSR